MGNSARSSKVVSNTRRFPQCAVTGFPSSLSLFDCIRSQEGNIVRPITVNIDLPSYDQRAVANGVSLSVGESIFVCINLIFIDITVKINGSTNVTTATTVSNRHTQLPADSQAESVGLVCGLATTWRSVCIHEMNRMNSCNGLTMMTAP